MLVQLAEDLARIRFKNNPDSRVDRIESYYELEDGHRLDVVGLTTDGELALTIEAERVNNDLAEAALTDFDKMAACEPDDAIWVVTSQADAVSIMNALHDPKTGSPRIDRTYSHTTPTRDYIFDTPGLTDIATIADIKTLLTD